MAKIKVDLSYTIIDGSEVVFTAPCNCSETDGLKVYYPDGSKEFTFKDAHGNALTGIGEAFAKGALVKVILDVTNSFAYIQNADTNSYIESTKATVPKSASGSVISVKDSIAAPLHGLTLYGKTTQITTTGKNLWSQGDVSVTGSVGYMSITLATPLPAGTYTLSAVVTSTDTDNNYCTVAFPDASSSGSNVNVQLYRGSRSSAIVVIGREATTMRFNAAGTIGTSSGDKATFKDIQIEVGEVATDYEPYTCGKASPNPDYPQELVTVGASGSVGVSVPGKNLFDYATHIANNCQSTIPVVAGKTLYRNGRAGSAAKWTLYDTTGNSLGTFSSLDFTATNPLVLPANASYIVTTDDNATVILDFYLGYDSNTDYEPYKGQTLTAQTPNGLPGVPILPELSNEATTHDCTDESGTKWCCDVIDYARGVRRNRIVFKVLDGTETWTKPSSNYHSCKLGEFGSIISGAQLSNRLPGVKTSNSVTTYGIYAVNSAGQDSACIFVRTEETTKMTITEFKAWLSEHPITVAYALATPIETPLSAEELAAFAALHTNKPETTVYNDAGAYMDVEYFATNAAVPMNYGRPHDSGKILAIDETGCVAKVVGTPAMVGITAGTIDITAGSSALATGAYYDVYE